MDDEGAEALIVKASAADVTLMDNADNSGRIVRNQFANVTLSGRTLAMDGTWNTLCLPFDVYAFEAMDDDHNFLFPLVGATVKELDIDGTYDANGNPAADGPYKSGLDTQTGELRLYFREVRTIEAGKPYIVKWSSSSRESLTDPVFRNVILKDDIKPVAFPGGTFTGQFSPFTIVAPGATLGENQGHQDEILFFASAPATVPEGSSEGNSVSVTKTTVLGYSATVGRTLRSCRAHFNIPAGQVAAGARSVVSTVLLNFDDDTPSAITDLLLDDTTPATAITNAWYSLDGRRLDGKPAAKGLYIHNGRKIVVK